MEWPNYISSIIRSFIVPPPPAYCPDAWPLRDWADLPPFHPADRGNRDAARARPGDMPEDRRAGGRAAPLTSKKEEQ
ncbi:hypothetical protein EMQ25_13755 [Arsenicitalea aurantiaca]|uniref:Uncharacterized protein n=1 Tax=Arsenicitalea aurantiaca TaxID=1783274 RepID=A0A433X8E7_9HYPH|nr:hypothetical protein [Arsenicitalea aurantiaca]RUT30367.1 hypothetical protein EMQ25_13755 [Arsenicitalea aurantiaca]